MKIIKRGVEHEWWIGRMLHCKRCHSEMQLELTDKPDPAGNRDGGDLYKVECPVCTAAILFEYLPQ